MNFINSYVPRALDLCSMLWTPLLNRVEKILLLVFHGYDAASAKQLTAMMRSPCTAPRTLRQDLSSRRSCPLSTPCLPHLHLPVVGRRGTSARDHAGRRCMSSSVTPSPGLYALGQHDSLVAASAALRPDERFAAFLDDLYVVTVPGRTAPLLRVVTSEVERGAGVEANLGKTRVFTTQLRGCALLGPDVWCGNLPPEQRGFVAVGVPIGHPMPPRLR